MEPQNCSVSLILQNIFLCVQQNKDIHTGLELLESEQMNYAFNWPSFRTVVYYISSVSHLWVLWAASIVLLMPDKFQLYGKVYKLSALHFIYQFIGRKVWNNMRATEVYFWLNYPSSLQP